MSLDYSQLGKRNKKAGARFEKEIADDLSKEFEEKVIPTPRSGGLKAYKKQKISDFPGDLMVLGSSPSVLQDLFFECKYTQNLTLGSWEQELEGKVPLGKCKTYIWQKPAPPGERKNIFILMPYEHFKKILKELDGYRKDEP